MRATIYFREPAILRLYEHCGFVAYKLQKLTLIGFLMPEGYKLSTLTDVCEMLKQARGEARLSQEAIATRAGVSRSTVARMETMAKGDMSVSALVRLLEAAGYDLKLVKAGHQRTVEDILAEQRSGASE
ncbi:MULTISPECIES: helix-turn-helix domain-containing protein [unclassified Pseudomonas]|uniref:helix-turn-helix domain-containing protein n=1 Tax=unclassified Pseudomonas TaxID=196821 RepID=UPI0025E8B1FA|nr:MULTISPECIES: helix-turn-helix transcriptional regulator [unclassified Pseudomonas]